MRQLVSPILKNSLKSFELNLTSKPRACLRQIERLHGPRLNKSTISKFAPILTSERNCSGQRLKVVLKTLDVASQDIKKPQLKLWQT